MTQVCGEVQTFYNELFFTLIAGDLEISLLKKRLEETEKAMERIVAQVSMASFLAGRHDQAGVGDDQDGFSTSNLCRWGPSPPGWHRTSSRRQWMMLIDRCCST